MSDPEAVIVAALINGAVALLCELIRLFAGDPPSTRRFRTANWRRARNFFAGAFAVSLMVFLALYIWPRHQDDQPQSPCQIYGVSDPCLNELRRLYAGAVSPDLTGIIATGRDGFEPVYKVGEKITIAFRSTRSAYYILLNRDSTGAYQSIAPAEDHPQKLEAEQPLAIPASDSPSLHVSRPAGPARLILILSSVPTKQLFSAPDPSQFNFAVVELRYWVNP